MGVVDLSLLPAELKVVTPPSPPIILAPKEEKREKSEKKVKVKEEKTVEVSTTTVSKEKREKSSKSTKEKGDDSTSSKPYLKQEKVDATPKVKAEPSTKPTKDLSGEGDTSSSKSSTPQLRKSSVDVIDSAHSTTSTTKVVREKIGKDKEKSSTTTPILAVKKEKKVEVEVLPRPKLPSTTPKVEAKLKSTEKSEKKKTPLVIQVNSAGVSSASPSPSMPSPKPMPISGGLKKRDGTDSHFPQLSPSISVVKKKPSTTTAPLPIPPRKAAGGMDLLDTIIARQDVLLADKYKSEQEKAQEKQRFELEKRRMSAAAQGLSLGPLEVSGRKHHRSTSGELPSLIYTPIDNGSGNNASAKLEDVVEEGTSLPRSFVRDPLNLANIEPEPPKVQTNSPQGSASFPSKPENNANKGPRRGFDSEPTTLSPKVIAVQGSSIGFGKPIKIFCYRVFKVMEKSSSITPLRPVSDFKGTPPPETSILYRANTDRIHEYTKNKR
jgi:hypothetical protein